MEPVPFLFSNLDVKNIEKLNETKAETNMTEGEEKPALNMTLPETNLTEGEALPTGGEQAEGT